MSESASFSILRIKRKRTANQLPLDALVIEQPEPSTKRRKASHHPPAKTSRGIFRFAETVSIDSFDDPTKTRKVKDRIQSFLTKPSTISNLQKESIRPLARIPSSASLRSPSVPPSPVAATPKGTGRKLPSSAASLNFAAPSSSSSSSPSSVVGGGGGTAPTQPLLLQRKRTRYRIIPEPSRTTSPPPPLTTTTATSTSTVSLLLAQERAAYELELVEEDEIRRGLRPPRVSSLSEIKARDERRARLSRLEQEELHARGKVTRIYDAIAEGEDDDGDDAEEAERLKLKKKKVKRVGTNALEKDDKDQTMMDNFGDMLKEYLTLQDSTERQNLPPSSTLLPNSAVCSSLDAREEEEEQEDEGGGEEEETDSGGEFVYDVYYRDLRETSNVAGFASTGGSGSSTPLVTGGGSNGFDVGSLEGLKRIGELAGLEEDEDLLLRVDGEGDSETEEEDNADQDSNEENDYRNDYPDEESEDEDRWDQEDDEGADEDDDDY